MARRSAGVREGFESFWVTPDRQPGRDVPEQEGRSTVVSRSEPPSTGRPWESGASCGWRVALARIESNPASRVVVAVGGLVASGKTTVAEEISRALGGVHIEADRIRDEILGIGSGPAAHQRAWPQNLAAGVTAEIYAELMARGRNILARGGRPILDGCFARRAQRQQAQALASAHDARFLFVECHAEAGKRRERLVARSAASCVAPEGWLALLERIEGRWEPVSELRPLDHLRVDTSRPIAAAVEELLLRLASPATGDSRPSGAAR